MMCTNCTAFKAADNIKDGGFCTLHNKKLTFAMIRDPNSHCEESKRYDEAGACLDCHA